MAFNVHNNSPIQPLVNRLISRVEFYWCILSHKTKLENLLSMCSPQTLFQAFNQKPFDFGTGNRMCKNASFYVLGLTLAALYCLRHNVHCVARQRKQMITFRVENDVFVVTSTFGSMEHIII